MLLFLAESVYYIFLVLLWFGADREYYQNYLPGHLGACSDLGKGYRKETKNYAASQSIVELFPDFIFAPAYFGDFCYKAVRGDLRRGV